MKPTTRSSWFNASSMAGHPGIYTHRQIPGAIHPRTVDAIVRSVREPKPGTSNTVESRRQGSAHTVGQVMAMYPGWGL